MAEFRWWKTALLTIWKLWILNFGKISYLKMSKVTKNSGTNSGTNSELFKWWKWQIWGFPNCAQKCPKEFGLKQNISMSERPLIGKAKTCLRSKQFVYIFNCLFTKEWKSCFDFKHILALPSRGQKCIVSALFQFLLDIFDLWLPVQKI